MSFFKNWVKAEPAPASVEPGNRFCRRRRDHVTETATVLELRPDPFGIPHVHFTLAFEQPSQGSVYEGLRVLALRTFVDAYPERVA
jgi:hypothetical protein